MLAISISCNGGLDPAEPVGIGAARLRTVVAHRTFWESILPEKGLRLPAEIWSVDQLLEDAVFLEPYRVLLHSIIGRPSMPIDTYLRLMFLNSCYRRGFEPFCQEVADWISWRRSCRISLGVRRPAPTPCRLSDRLWTVFQGCDEDCMSGGCAEGGRGLLGELPLGSTPVRCTNGRVTSAPTLGAEVKRRGCSDQRGLRPHRHPCNQRGRRGSSKRPFTSRAISSRHVRPATEDLSVTARLVETVASELHERLPGKVPDGSRRLVSLHDSGTRRIRKGRTGTPVELGYKAQLVDSEGGVVLDQNVELGNPNDAAQLAPAIAGFTLFLSKAREVAHRE